MKKRVGIFLICVAIACSFSLMALGDALGSDDFCALVSATLIESEELDGWGALDGVHFSEERTLEIEVTLDESEEGFSPDDSAKHLVSCITDVILYDESWDQYWDVIIVHFAEVGYITNTKDNIATAEFYGEIIRFFEGEGLGKDFIIEVY